ncbi:phage tail protein, partial [Streptomyces sp. WMMC897]|nr:hypothetical protein [Streptomyces sp. WMMC897]
GGFVAKLTTTLTEKLPEWWNSFTGWIATKATQAGAALDVLGTAVGDWFGGLWSKYVSGPVGRQWDSWIGSVQRLPGRTVGALSSLGGRLASSASGAWQDFKGAAARKGAEIVSWTGRLPGRLKRAVGSTGRLLYYKGRDVVTGLWNGVSSLGGWLYSKVSGFVRNNVVSAAKSILRIGSPSRVMADEIGHWLPPGIAQGAEDNAGVLDKTIQTIVTPLTVAPPPGTGARPGTMAPLLGSQAASRNAPVVIELRGDRELVQLFRRGARRRGGNADIVFT